MLNCKKGDILLVRYHYDPLGMAIRKITNSYWNHATWILDKDNILEVRNKRVEILSITAYSNKRFYDTKVVRLKNIKTSVLDLALNHAISKIGSLSYIQWVFSLILVWIQYKGRFTQVTCSGLIAESLDKVGWRFKEWKNPYLISPEDINSSNNIKEIKIYAKY